MASLKQLKLAVSDFPSFVESLGRNYQRHCCDTFAAGCIAHSLPAWRKVTSDNEILCTVMGITIDFDTTHHKKIFPQLHKVHY